jgi:predicted glycosyltransferase
MNALPTSRRAMIVVTHLLGVGHLARMAAVGRALVAEGWDVTLVSGGRPVPTARLGGCTLVQMPPVHCVGTDFRTLFAADGTAADATYLARRREALLEAYQATRPQALIIELYPFGRRALAGEFEALLERARSSDPRPAILSSIRDVLNPPSRPDRADEALARLARSFDGALFHGDAAVVPLGASWPTPPALERRLIETGYVHDGDVGTGNGGEDGRDEIVVSGGGSAASLPLCRAAIEAARLLPERRWRLLVGHGVAADDFAALGAAAPPHMVVERARPDFPALLARSALSISQAGYNTVLDLAAAHARAILVPFAAGNEQEQTIRAGELARRGLASLLETAGLDGPTLAGEAARLLAEPRPDWSAIHAGGTKRTVGAVASVTERAGARAEAWRALDAALERARNAGRTLDFWLRDDDAVAPTPALDGYLDRARRWNIPAALAVIPARATPELAAYLADQPLVDVLVHGWSHRNHAPEGARASEFGIDRPEPDKRSDAERGLARIREVFGARASAVFVPPWNRIDPGFAAALPQLGYSGVSTHERRTGGAPTGLVTINSHWDPIAWKAGGGLKDEAKLLHLLRRLIDEELAAPAGTLEPIGILTHHLVHDGWIDRFLDEVFERLAGSGTARFVAAHDLFGEVREPAPAAI